MAVRGGVCHGAGRVHHGPFGVNIFFPNEAWRAERDLLGRRRWPSRPGFAMMVS
jgi:hypothetical protein